MEKHFESLLSFVPDLLHRRILDLGSGRGKFLIDMSRRGAEVVGYEKSEEYADISREELRSAGLSAEVVVGSGESLPFPDGSFGFINMSEVIEHVEDPDAVLRETYRVLKRGGGMYVSVPNRFGYKDPHYHLYFVNWLPRSWSEAYIRLRGKAKNYDGKAGRQQLSAMHYYTYDEFRRLVASVGFGFIDTRKEKIRRMPLFKRMFFVPVYAFFRPWYFDTFHFFLTREK